MGFIDLSGRKFGRLSVIERAENRIAAWKCRCDCGNEVIVSSNSLKSGATQSCGCLRGQSHGMTDAPIYKIWKGIKDRCLNPNHQSYKHYGGRGITMYSEWIEDIKAFYEYVSKLDHFNEDGYSLDRIDNGGNYAPGNLRWTDRRTQGRNKRNNVIVEYNGVEMPLSQAAELSGINYGTLYRRYHHGDRSSRLFRPVRSQSPAKK